jgi:cell division GTPase FtsZ
MHEINAAAETITAAADPDANIIFGATINPELDGEVIITVVATGFDDSYYAKRGAATGARLASGPKLDNSNVGQPDEKALSEIDMDLSDTPDEHEFTRETPLSNIWSLDDKDESDKAEEKTEDDEDDEKEDKDDKKDSDDQAIISSNLEEELEKPSFLRRLGRRRHQDDDHDDNTSTRSPDSE